MGRKDNVGKRAGSAAYETRRLASLQRRLWRLNLALALIIFLVLAVWWIGIEFGLFPEPSEKTELLMEQADLFAIGIFAIELYSGFKKAQDKALFLRKRWLEIIVLLPIGVFFRAFRALSELEAVARAKSAVRLGEMPVLIPELAVAGKAAGRGLAFVHHWLCHFSVFSDFICLVLKWRRRIPI